MAFETVELATIRQNTFATLFTLINNNKPTGWNVFSGYPEDEANSNFPMIILNPAMIKPIIVTMDGGGIIVEDIDAEVEFFALGKKGKDQIDIGKDNVQNTILSNSSTLDTYKLYLKEDPFDDSNVDVFISGKQKINTGSSIIKLGLN